MKILAKILFIILWSVLILGCGYYTVYSNLGSILFTGSSNFSCRLISGGVRFSLGESVEVVKFKFPLQLITKDDQWIVRTHRGAVCFSFAPRLRVKWQKESLRRSSEMNGE